MYTEYRSDDENTPEAWAQALPPSRGLTTLRRAKLRLDRRYSLIRKHLAPPILDAGCGMGDWVAYLNERGLETWGLDYSHEMIASDARTYPSHKWLQGRLEDIPVADDTLGGIISWGVIEHDPQGPGEFIREFRRVLRTGGAVVATVPLDSPEQREASRTQFPSGDVFFQRFYTADELAKLFADEGFEVLGTEICARAHPALLWPRAYAKHPAWRQAMLYAAAPFPRRYGNMVACVARKT